MARGTVLRTVLRTIHWSAPALVIALGVALLPNASVAARTPSRSPSRAAAGSVRYAHDAAGRLVGVTANGQTARYDYDASGNPVEIDRYPSTTTSVLSVVPERAAPGSSVTITGTAFADTPTGNAVTIGGADATVARASTDSLTVTVPDGASSGKVTVKTGDATATAHDPFTVTEAQPQPRITGLSSTTGDRGDTVTITGSGFADAAHDVVTFNRTRARVRSASADQLTVTVPDAAGPGQVSVRTPGGTATSDQAFFPAPRETFPDPDGYTAAQIASTGDIAVNGASKRVTIPQNKIAILRFHAVKGQDLDLGITDSTIKTQLWAPAYDPYGAGFGRVQYNRPPGDSSLKYVEDFTPPGWFVGDTGFPFTQTVPVTGDYSLVLDPDGAGHGSVTVTLSTRATGTVTPGGEAVTVQARRPGQFTDLSFSATKDEPLSVGYSDPAGGKDFGAFTRITGPYGEYERDRVLVPAGSGGIPFIAHATGTHHLIVGPYRGETTSAQVRIARITAVGKLAVGGAGTKVTAAKAGESTLLQFTGTPGDKLTLNVGDSTFGKHPALTVYQPWGVSFSGGDTDKIVLPGIPDPLEGYEKLPYEVVVDPRNTTGSAQVTLTHSTAGAKPDATVAPPGRTIGPERTNVSEPARGQPEVWKPAARNLNGGPWTSGRGRAPLDVPAAYHAPTGVTAVSGRVLALNGTPLRGATISVAGKRTTTGRDGAFLLRGVPAGHQVLHADGRSADRAGHTYGRFDMGVNLVRGTTTPLPQTIWMPLLDTGHEQRIGSPTGKETVLRTPRIPGLEVHIPKGTVIRDDSGKIVHKVGITAIPVDRTPFPLPENSPVPIYYTIQPGGAYLFPKGARIVYPNYWHLKPGTRVPFTQYDPKGRGWYVYGHGTVTPDGKQVVPDKGVRVYQFTGAMILPPDPPGAPSTGPPQSSGGGSTDGDPVDLATGLLLDQHTDLSLPDDQSIAVRRTYRQNDGNQHAFGIGANVEDGQYLYADGFDSQYQTAYVIQPDGSRVTFRLITTQAPVDVGLDAFETVAYRADPTPGEFQNATMAWNGNGWDLRETNGTTLTFNDEGPLRAVRDQYGNTTTITRDPARVDTDGNRRERGAIAQVTSPNGRWIAYTHENVGGDLDKWRFTRARDNAGRTVKYAYDSAGMLSSVTNPRGGVTKYAYDAKNRMTSIIDPRGTTYLRNTYDDAGRVVEQRDANGGTYKFAYTTGSSGAVTATQVTDPLGHVRRVTFNAAGYITGDTSAYGTDQQQATKMTLDAAGHPTSVTDALNRRTDLAYDGNGNVTKITRLAGTPDARSTTFTYGPYDQVTSLTDPLGHTSTLTYGADGALTSTTDASGRTVRFASNEAGQVTSITDGLGHTTRVTYAMGDLTSATDPAGRTARQFTDAAGRVLSQTDPAGTVSTSEYDAADHVTRTTDALGNATALAYDGNGNLTSATDPRGDVTRFTYDKLDRATAATDPLKRTTTYAYDAGGNPTKMTSASGVATTYGYDELDRQVTVAYGGSGGTATSTYDAGDRLTKIDDSTSGVATFAYDGLDRLSRATTPQGAVAYGYDAADRRTSMTAAGQPKVTYGYDDADDLTRVSQDDYDVTLTYDAAARLTKESLPGVDQTYAYDPADQVTGITYGDLGSLGYAYDPAGNVAGLSGSFARTTVPNSVQASYDAADQLVERGSTAYAYNADGELTSAGATSYTWDTRGRMTGLKGPGTTASFGYDALGRRVQKTVNSQKASYLYDGLNPVREDDGDVGWNLLSGGVDRYFLRSQTEPGSGTAAPKVFRPRQTYLTDALGSTLALTDDQGSVQANYTYDPFGATTATGEDEDNPFQYTGRENDDTGQYYDRARYYSPGDQRFTSPDPLGLAAGDTNPYTYTYDDPADLTDPLGTKPDDTDQPDECTPNSFPDDTRVLMADGTRKPIRDVRAGDRVRTLDPATGQTASRRVDTIITGEGDKTLTTITIATGHGTKTLTATDNHPFWAADLGGWVKAGDLRSGIRLRTPSGSYVEVTGVRTYAVADEHVRNLTVSGTHTYYAMAGGTPVLVHNENTVPEEPPANYEGRHQDPFDVVNRQTRKARLLRALPAAYEAYDSAGSRLDFVVPDVVEQHFPVTSTVGKYAGRVIWGVRRGIKEYNENAVEGGEHRYEGPQHRSESRRGRHAKGNRPALPGEECESE